MEEEGGEEHLHTTELELEPETPAMSPIRLPDSDEDEQPLDKKKKKKRKKREGSKKKKKHKKSKKHKKKKQKLNPRAFIESEAEVSGSEIENDDDDDEYDEDLAGMIVDDDEEEFMSDSGESDEENDFVALDVDELAHLAEETGQAVPKSGVDLEADLSDDDVEEAPRQRKRLKERKKTRVVEDDPYAPIPERSFVVDDTCVLECLVLHVGVEARVTMWTTRVRRVVQDYSGAADEQMQAALEIFGNMDDFLFGNQAVSAPSKEKRDDVEEAEIQNMPETTEADRILKERRMETLLRRKETEQKKRSRMEPEEARLLFKTDQDRMIMEADLPERVAELRLQLGLDLTAPEQPEANYRDMEVKEEVLEQYQEEADAVRKHMFSRLRIQSEHEADFTRSIQFVLKFLSEDCVEVPFITTYRDDYLHNLSLHQGWSTRPAPVKPEGGEAGEEDDVDVSETQRKDPSVSSPEGKARLADMAWSIDEFHQKWLHLGHRREKLSQMIDRCRVSPISIQSYMDLADNEEQLDDVHEALRALTLDERETNAAPASYDDRKKPVRRGVTLGALDHQDAEQLDKVLEAMGSPDSFMSNLIQSMRTAPDPTQSPSDVASELLSSSRHRTTQTLLNAAVRVAAKRLGTYPEIREYARQAFCDNAVVSSQPTEEGKRTIDWTHKYVMVKRIENKPYRNFERNLRDPEDYHQARTGVQFALLEQASQDGVIEYSCDLKDPATRPLYTFFANCYLRVVREDEPDDVRQLHEQWNELRKEVLDVAVNKYLLPMARECAKKALLSKSHEKIAKEAALHLKDFASQGPVSLLLENVPTHDSDDEDDVGAEESNTRIVSIYVGSIKEPSYVVSVNKMGDLVDHQTLHFMKNSTLNRKRLQDGSVPYSEKVGAQSLELQKQRDIDDFRSFVELNQPKMIIIGASSMEAQRFKEIVQEALKPTQNFGEEERPAPSVFFVDPCISNIYANTPRAQEEFKNYPVGMLMALSLGRRALFPLEQLCALWFDDGKDNDILSLPLHPLQALVPKDIRLRYLRQVLMDEVNKVGVDVNTVVARSHLSGCLQFVCGLGPRKAKHLVESVMQDHGFVVSRNAIKALLDKEIVFRNCAGFLRIHSNDQMRLNNEHASFAFDSSRIHPEDYPTAVQVVNDSLELDDPPSSPSTVEDRIHELQTLGPEQTSSLDLAMYAQALVEQNQVNKLCVLNLVAVELHHPFVDGREPMMEPVGKELFFMLSGESEQTLRVAQVVEVRVTNLLPGGVLVRLDSDVKGFVHYSKLNEDCPREGGREWAMERGIQAASVLKARVVAFDFERFSVQLDSTESTLARHSLEKEELYQDWEDNYVNLSHPDDDLELKRKEKLAELRKSRRFEPRNIEFPLFKNVSREEAEQELRSKDDGSFLIRPSTRSVNELTLTWKMSGDPELMVHLQIKESEKEHKYTLGKTLEVLHRKFEDLDEIASRLVPSLNNLVHSMMDYKNFRFVLNSEDELDSALRDERSDSSRAVYSLGFSTKRPGMFVLAFLPGKQQVWKDYVSLKMEGYSFMKKTFATPDRLVNYFKQNFKSIMRKKEDKHKHRQRAMQQEQDYGFSSQPMAYNHPSARASNFSDRPSSTSGGGGGGGGGGFSSYPPPSQSQRSSGGFSSHPPPSSSQQSDHTSYSATPSSSSFSSYPPEQHYSQPQANPYDSRQSQFQSQPPPRSSTPPPPPPPSHHNDGNTTKNGFSSSGIHPDRLRRIQASDRSGSDKKDEFAMPESRQRHRDSGSSRSRSRYDDGYREKDYSGSSSRRESSRSSSRYSRSR